MNPWVDRFPFAARAEFWLAAVLAVVTLVLFWPAAHFDYINFDDYLYVSENPMVTAGLTWAGVQQAFTTIHEQWWLPLLWLSYMADIAVFGAGPHGHHLVNILLHAVNTVLLFGVLFRMTGSRWRSAFVATLFAWHPTRVEAVAWIAARKDVLSGLFFMLALLAYGRHAARPAARRIGLVAGLMLAGLMTKAILIILPPVLLLLDFWPLRRAPKPWGAGAWTAWKPLLREKALLILLAAVFMGINLTTHTTGRGVGATVSLGARLGLIAPNYLDYLGKIVAPVRLSCYYCENDVVSWPLTAVALLGLGAVTWLVLKQADQRPYWLTGWLWFLVALLPVIRGVRLGMAQYADRWLYLPMIGLAIALAWTLAEGGARPMLRRAILGACGIVLALCLIRSHAQLPHWENSFTLFRRAAYLAPASHFTRNSLGLALMDRGQYAEALHHFEVAIELWPVHADYLSNKGVALFKMGRTEESRAFLQDVVDRNGKVDANILNNLGRAQAELGRTEEAMAAYECALGLEPVHPEANYNLAFELFKQGRAAEALPHFQRAVQRRPGNVTMWYNLGIAYAELGRYAEAEPCMLRTLQIEPDYPGARASLGRLQLLLSLQAEPASPGGSGTASAE